MQHLCLLLLLLLQLLKLSPVEARTVPPYERGKDKYQWFLKPAELERGLAHYGSAERLRAKMADLLNGGTIKLTMVGGSITAGQGAVDAPNWSQYVFNWFEDHFPGQTQGHLGAVGGTMTTYMVVCHNVHIPRDSDIIFLEYSINDHQAPMPHFQNEPRRGMERLLRRLLQYPKHPAVVLMHTFRWSAPSPQPGAFWTNAEREFGELALYYNLPELSLKGCCYHNMVKDEPGFSIRRTRGEAQDALRDIAFYWDVVHVDGRTGCRAMAELAIHLLLKALQDVKARPLSAEDRAAIDEALPVPMIADNWESQSDKCFIGTLFRDSVVGKEGFEWINESKTPRPKWGMVATTPGSKLRMKIDTRTADSTRGAGDKLVLVELAYLKSYENMGMAKVTCEAGCTCDPTDIDGHHLMRESQLNLHNFYASQSADCIVVVTVLSETHGNGNKVKIAGIMVSEQAGASQGIQNSMAVEYVHDISMRGKDGVFELRNHARL